ncbi:MAG: hypothetical protein ACE15B_10980 [Bryobacteraceae bacterium]
MKRSLFALLAAALIFSGAAYAQNTLTVSAASLSFTATAGGAVPAPVTLQVASTTPGVPFTTSVNQSWLSVFPTSGTTPTQLSVGVNQTLLQAGNTYTGAILISANGVTNPQVQVQVTLNVLSPYQLVASPSSLTFDIAQGSTQPVTKQLTVSAGMATPFTVAVSSSGNWLSASPATATTNTSVNVSVDPTKLAAGSSSGNITLTPLTGGTAPVQVQVTANVTAPPSLLANPASLTFNWLVNSTAPAPQQLEIKASNNAAVPVTIEVPAGVFWIVPSLSNTVTPATITVGVNPVSAQLGANKSKLVIRSANASNVLEVPVTLNSSTSPLLTSSPSSLSFSYQPGTPLPATQKVTIGSTGAALTFTAVSDVPWLSVPASGSSGADLTIGLNQTGLAGLGPGTYNAKITLTSTGSPLPLEIPVQLTVTNLPALVSSRSALMFNQQVGGAAPAPQQVTITSTGGPLNYTVGVSTETGGAWLTADVAGGSTTGIITLRAAGAAEGVHRGSVTLTAAGAANTLTIPVTFYVSSRPLLNADPYALTFTAQRGSAAQSLEILLSSTSATEPVSFTTTKAAGADWLGILGTTTGQTPARMTVFVSPALVPDVGTYTGTLIINATTGSPAVATANSPFSVQVTLNVTSGSLTVTPSTLQPFTQVVGGTAPAAQTLAVANTIGASNFTASSSAAWLTVTPASGTTPANVSVSVNGTGLSAGTYNGTVTISVPGAANSPQNIPVTFTVSAASIAVTPLSLNFAQNVGGAPPAAQKLSVSSSGVPVNFTAVVTAGANWLTVSPVGGVTPFDLNVTVNASGLTPGTYTGAITISGTGANQITVPVNLTVSPALTLVVTPSTLNFTAQVGGAAPSPQNFQVASSGGVLTFSVTGTTSSGGNWMTMTPSSGNTPGPVTVGINPATLAAGNYIGTILVSAAGASNSPQTVTVNLTVQPPPAPVPSAIVSAATNAPGAVAPGEFVTIYGTGVGPSTPAYLTVVNGFVTTTLSDTRVLFDDIPAPLTYVGSSQINAVVPYEIAGRPTVRFQVEYKGTRSNAITLTVTDTVPGIFTQNASGSGPGAILNQDYSVNTSSRPAAKGSVVMVFATGEGATTPRGETGRVILDASQLKKPVQDVTATVGGRPAQVQYAGSAPGFISGVMQVNVVIPEDAASGAQSIVIKAGNNSSPATVTVAVQ